MKIFSDVTIEKKDFPLEIQTFVQFLLWNRHKDCASNNIVGEASREIHKVITVRWRPFHCLAAIITLSPAGVNRKPCWHQITVTSSRV